MKGLEDMRKTLVVVITAYFVFSACAQTDFKAAPRVKTSADASSFMLKCDENTGEAIDKFEISSSYGAEVTLTGEFCGKPQVEKSGDVTILFVIDHSGSMQNGGRGMPANDPLVGDSCGRLEAGKAIVNKMKSIQGTDATMKFAAISFADHANVMAEPVSADGFESHLTSEEFCGSTGYTNYEAAITAAHDLLKRSNDPAVIYFISDGYPTTSDSGSFGNIFTNSSLSNEYFKVAEEAATSLRNDLENVVFNAIFLGNATPSGVASSDPKEDLAKLTGSIDRVRQVTDAGDLAEEIQTFEDPVGVTISETSASGKLTAMSFDQRKIKVSSLEPHPSKEDVWVFETEPFKLFGTHGETVINEALFEVESSGGSTLTARATISYEMK